MEQKNRVARIERATKETMINVDVKIDGGGDCELDTPIPFLNHMLHLFAVHGHFDLHIKARGDTEIDNHHTVEDIGICLGLAFKEALSDKKGICRYGNQTVPMDEALAQVILDISNRPLFLYRGIELKEKIGSFETELIPEFFRAFANNSGITLHILVKYGENSHHIVESIFKAWGRAMDQATRIDTRNKGKVVSSKGVL